MAATPRRYAEKTKVPVERSKVEIEKLLTQHGADGFAIGWDAKLGLSTMVFRLDEHTVRFVVAVPDPSEFRCSEAGNIRTEIQTQGAVNQEHRRRWRSLLLIVKAKLEVVASGDSTLEREFLADMLLPSGQTFGEWVTPQLANIGDMMPRMLPGGD